MTLMEGKWGGRGAEAIPGNDKDVEHCSEALLLKEAITRREGLSFETTVTYPDQCRAYRKFSAMTNKK